MSHPVASQSLPRRTGGLASSRLLQSVLLGVTLTVGSFFVPFVIPRLVMLGAGLGLLGVGASLWLIGRRGGLAAIRKIRQVSAILSNDQSPIFVTGRDGAILYTNAAAEERCGECRQNPLAHAFRDIFANPAAVLFRLQNRAQAQYSAHEDVVTRRGHIRLAVHPLAANLFLWRVEDFGERGANTRGAEGLSLPMLTASKSGTVLFMNEAMRRVCGGRIKLLEQIFSEMPIRPGETQEVIGRDGPVKTFVAEIEGAGGRREIYFVPGLASGGVSQTTPVLDDLPVPLLKIGDGGTVEEANLLARELLAMPETGNFTVSDLVEGLGRSVRDWLDAAMQGHGLHMSEVIRARLPEQEVFLQITLTRINDGDRNLLVAVLTDATELKTLEAQFVQSQKMQAIGQLAGGVAHDFNNLLTAISGHCDLLLLRHDQGDPDYADLVQINENANRAASLVGQLLAFSRKQTLQPERIDLRDTLSDLTHLLNRLVGEKITLSLSHDPALLPMRADKRQLEQVIMNLVVNARDAMPEGGEIRIETRMKTFERPMLRDRVEMPAGEYVCVQVFDDGCGIPSDQLSKVFEPFFTTKRTGEGTGLGLSMAYGIVKQSGGFIFIDSVVGTGTTFSLYFPSYSAEGVDLLEPALPDDPEDHMEAASGVVLLVEDEVPVRAFTSRALRMRGYTVLEAENAEEALKTLEDESLAIDLFVTDVIMPGLDGPSWVRKALETRPDAKVVFVSGYAEDVFDGTEDPVPNSVFLPKPYSLAELTSVVNRQLR